MSVMHIHETPSGTRMMCDASVNAIWARAHGTGSTARIVGTPGSLAQGAAGARHAMGMIRRRARLRYNGTVAEDEPADVLLSSEARWPMAAAVLVTIALTLFVPDELRFFPRGLLPVVEAGLLLAIVLGDPGAIDRRARWLRVASITLVVALVGGALWSTALLIDALIDGSAATDSGGDLLATGAAVWVGNNVAFALLYWELDSGGPAVRAHVRAPHPDFAFPQHMNPELAPADWRPMFVDYLYLGFTNATAFSPTDAMPLRAWAKLTMIGQASISLALLGLVVARAVNVFT
jgi:hypothetical protein